MRRVFSFIAIAGIAALIGWFGRGLMTPGTGSQNLPQRQAAGGAGPPGVAAESYRDLHPEAPVPVVVGPVRQVDQPIYLNGLGTVTAFNTVQVKARLDGQLTELRFEEGQDVKRGDVLAIIDQRPYKAALKQAEATLAKDQATLANARRDLDRDMSIGEFASRQKTDGERATVAEEEAQVENDRAQIDTARTNLDYTTITAPIDGRTGIRGVDVGNIVHAADATQIVTLTQVQPISVVFTLPADALPGIVKGMAAGTLAVQALAKDNDTPLAEGTLALVDNQIDSTTGTVKLKAWFANADRALWPGQFVNARLRVEIAKGAIVVPATVVQRGPDGAFAWVVDEQRQVAMRPITVRQIQDGTALVGSGLKPGEQVVIDGQYKLQPGRKIEPLAPSPGRPA